jgi:hypothetical protein
MAKVQAASTQEHVPIAGVRNGIIIMKDGSFRLVLNISPINFSLKSEQEQNSIVFKYQSFLNSLHFPIQITMQSKKLDLTPYLQKMKKVAEKQTNELLRIQTEDYISFVGELINIANIMSKSFFVSLSYLPLSMPKISFLEKLTGQGASGNVLKISDTDFNTHSKELLERGNTIASNLGSMGLRVRQLSTQEILEMFYNLYNPEEAGKERLINVDDMEASVVVDKNEAITAHAAAESQDEKPAIDNSEAVEAASKQEASASNPLVAQAPATDATATLGPVTPTNPATEPIVTAKAEDVPPPIKQRLEKQTSAPADQPEPAPPAAAPSGTAAEEPEQPLTNDNYQLQ